MAENENVSDVYIVSAVRTPIGKFMGGLASFPAPALGSLAVREAVRRVDVVPTAVDEVIMGCVLQAGLGQNPARQAALRGGLPDSVGAVTINKVCGSGLKSIIFGVQAIKTGDADVMSIRIESGLSPATTPCAPNSTSRTALPSGSIVITTRHSLPRVFRSASCSHCTAAAKRFTASALLSATASR